MKHQYFGDENDYRKYGIIRVLSGHGALSVGVFWMLTPDDGRTDGRFTGYLSDLRQRRHDSGLHDALSSAMATGDRHLRHVEERAMLPNARFFSALVPDSAAERQVVFSTGLSALAGADLLFFDPDNGIEVASRPRGRKNSSKFLYWKEIEAAYGAGHSLLIYQHFPRERRGPFTERLAEQLAQRTSAAQIATFTTPRVLFLLAAQPRHVEALKAGAATVARTWQTQVELATNGVAPDADDIRHR